MAAHRTSRRFPARTGRRSLAGGCLLAVIAIVSAGCLPSAERGVGSGSPGPSASSGPPAPTPSPLPSGPTPRPSYVRPTPTPAPTFVAYTVARGDSLNSIAKKFGTTARSIAYWNRATYPSLDPESSHYKPDLLQLGWTLLVVPHSTFDEQTLPEPSDLIGPSPTPTPSYDDGETEDPAAS